MRRDCCAPDAADRCPTLPPPAGRDARYATRYLPTFGGRLCHAGAVPAGYRARQERAERAAALRQELAAAVEAERFEDAAALRDRIRELEQEAR